MILDIRHKTLHLREKTQESRRKTQDLRFKSKEKRVRSNDFNHHSPKSVSSQTSHLHAKVCVSQTLIPEALQTSKAITQHSTFNIQHYKGALKILASIILYSFLFTPFSTKGQQTYPVKTSIAVKYPSVFLDEFADVTNTSATVTLLDLQKSNYNVLVKLTMESPDLKLSSKEMIPLTISGGIPTDLDFSDPNIAKLFALSNLIPEKGKVDEFLTNKALPEGLYLLKLEVYDANFPTINVSNIHANITAVLVQRFDPPLLNLPQDNGSVNQDPFSMNLFFSWTPRSVMANPAIQIYYQINMVEVPDGRNPYDAINIAGKVYPITMLADSGLTFPTFSFTPEQFPLQQGRTYAWQITAYEQDLSTGARRYQRFKNSGKSVVYTFTVQENCPQVNVASIITDVTGDKVNITWDKGYGHTEYELNYRELGSIYQYTPIRALVVHDNTDRQTVSIDISSLEKGIQYEFKIAAKCRSWQPDVYGGLFSVQKQDCSAPEPIKIESNTTEVVLTWDPTPNTQKYRLRYKGGNDALENEESIEVTSPTASLPALQANKTYQIILDAVCVSGNLDLGRPYTIHEGENGYAGGCPIPQPFKLIVDHTPGVQQTLFKWSADASIHQSYKFYVVRKDFYDIAPTSVAWAQATTTVPQLSIDTLVEDRLYAYKVDYVCDNGQISTTAVGYFKLEKEPTVAVNPGTGDCFPPATKTAEGLTDKSASFEWSKSADAEEYQLFYAPQGSNIFKVFNTTRLTTSIDDLDVSQTHIYQYTIRARCPNAKYSIFTDTALVDLSQRYTGTCKYEGIFRSDRQAANEIRLVWKHTPSMAYVVTYRDEAQNISDAYTAQINADSIAKNSLLDGDSIRFTVTNLAAKTNYVFHLQPVCGTEQGKKLGPLTVATLADANNGPCGQGKVICDSKSTVPLSQDSLIAMTKTKGDGVEYYEYDKASKKSMFSAADVEIIALDPLSYDATAKTFSGTGVAKLELDLGNVGASVTGSSNVNLTDRLKTSVKFTNIKINDARCLIGGAVEITGLELNVLSDEQKAKANKYVDQYNAVLKQLIDAGKQLSEALELAKDYTEQAENYLDGGQAYGNVKTGSVVPVPPNADYSVTGNVVKDNMGNTIGTLANPVPTLTAKDTTICKKCGNYIEFENPIGAKYDFDEYKAEYFTHRKVAREYKALRINSSKYYYVSAKAMVEGKVDKVKIKGLSGYNASDLTFRSGAGLTYNFNASTLTITLPGGAAGDGQDIYVYSKSKGDSVVGRLLVANYPTVTKKVVFVTVGDPTTWKTKPTFSVANVKTEVEKLLNTSYNRIGIGYTIELDEQTLKSDNSWDTNGDGMVQDSKSGFLDNDFTGEEKALTSLYYSYFDNLDTTKAYLFFTPDGKLTTGDLQGKMPRGRKGGFIFMNNSNLATVAKTVAHELAHGPHTLAHIFNSDWLNTDADQSNAANLMAYNSGVDLIKYQWDIMHDPGVVLGFFEKDKDAASIIKVTVSQWVKMLRDELNASFSTNEDLVYGILNLDAITVQAIVKEYGQEALLNDINKMDADEKDFMKFQLKSAGINILTTETSLIVDKTTMEADPDIDNAEIGVEIKYSVKTVYDSYTWFVLNDAIEVYTYNQNNSLDKNYRISGLSNINNSTFTTSFKGLHKIVCQVTKGNQVTYIERYQKVKEDPVKNSKPNITQTVVDNGPKLAAGTIMGYVVSSSQAKIREKIDPYNSLDPVKTLEKGKEVEIVKKLVEGDEPRALVKYKGTIEEFCTATTNITAMKAVSIENYFSIIKDLSSTKLPYSAINLKSLSKNTIVKVNMECGLYYQLRIQQGTTFIDGGWVLKTDLKKLGRDISDNFNWMTNVNIGTVNISGSSLEDILKNRDGVNDRTDASVYKYYDRLSPNGNGYVYNGKNLSTPTVEGSTTFETKVKKLVYEELKKEGGFSSMNTWDGEVFTWGRGLAATGSALGEVMEILMAKNEPNFKQIFSNIGISINNGKLSVLNDDGVWLTDDQRSLNTLYASLYIQKSTKLQSFFIELSEKKDYRDFIATEMWEKVADGAAKVPDYVYNTSKSEYSKSWSDASVTVLAHFSHWIPTKTWRRYDYSVTDGYLDKIIYRFIYKTIAGYNKNTTSSNPNPRLAKLETNIYRWNNAFKVLDKLHDFGSPTAVAEQKLKEVWNNHEIEIDFIKDKNSILRALKKDTENYVSNSDIVLIDTGTKYLILTEDATDITYLTIEKE